MPQFPTLPKFALMRLCGTQSKRTNVGDSQKSEQRKGDEMRYNVMVIREVWSTASVVADSEEEAREEIERSHSIPRLTSGGIPVQDDIRTYVISEEETA